MKGSPAEVFRQPEILAQAYIEPPQITQLAQRVSEYGFDMGTLTVTELFEQFKSTHRV